MVSALLLGMAMATPTQARLIRIPLRVNFEANKVTTRVFSGIKPGFQFDEVIPSWNIDRAGAGAIKLEIRSPKSGWMSLGDWSGDPAWFPRQSVKGQKDDYAAVFTDTFRTKELVDRIDLKVTLTAKPGASELARLKLLTLSFCNRASTKVATEWAPSNLWGSLVDVPQRAQGLYPNGRVLCSATCSSMLLWHWSNKLSRPPLDHDVPEVEAAVWDPVYNGAGNWPFNTAFIGSMKGMRACVSRLTGIEDLERLTKSGIPVACSVSFDMLRGRELSPTESGHLILCVGFEKDGTPIVNDPAFKDGVRKTYPRADFEKAWCYSNRTVYLVVPDAHPLPKDVHNVWGLR